MSYRILLVGGGSGGHVFPLISVADSLKNLAVKENKDVEIILLGEGRFFEEAAKNSGFKYKKILAGKFRRYFSLENFLDPFKMIAGFFQSFWHLFWLMPDAVFAKGGYASFFPVLAAKIFFIPIYIHDSDSVPGAANRFMAKMAKKIFISFESAKKYFPAEKTELVGNPVRKSLLNGDRSKAVSFFGLSESLPTVVILGGSQGAKKINNIILASIIQLTQNFQVIHQTGDKNFEEVKKFTEQLEKELEGPTAGQIKSRYKIYPFFNESELALAYALGDVFVSRASAGGIFEISALGKPLIVIPIKDSAQNHQYLNAIEITKYGATLIEEENLIASIFINEIKEAYQKKEELVAKIKSFARLDAAEKIAATVLESQALT